MTSSTEKKYVLIITYYWPPGSGPGVQRFLKFSKYFRDEGWEPIILSVKNGSYPSMDYSLEKNVPEGIRVIKTKTFEPFQLYNILKGNKGKSTGVGGVGISNPSKAQYIFNWIRANAFIPDARKGWKKYAIKAAKKLLKEQRIDAMITTGPPHSAHFIGQHLSKRYGIPWVADLRDPWTTVYYNELFPRTNRTEKKDMQLETDVLKSANAVTVVSEGLKSEFLERAKRIEVIYNGFDEEDIPNIKRARNDVFKMSYIGNFKPNQNNETVWQAISELKTENSDFANKFAIHLVGNIDHSVMGSIKQNQIEDLVNVSDFIPHQEAVKQMMTTDLLLFIIPQSKGNNLIITGKLFEYLASGNDILAIGPTDGNASSLISDAGREHMHNYNDKTAIKKQILASFERWNSGEIKEHSTESLYKYSRRSLTHQLSELLNEISQ